MGMVLIGSSITAAGIIIAVMILRIPLIGAPFLLLTAIVLVVMSAALILYGNKIDAAQ